MSTVDQQAREANAPEAWDALWSAPETSEWRAKALAAVYAEIDKALPRRATIVDLGGGSGALGELLQSQDRDVHVWDQSAYALRVARERGLWAHEVDLEQWRRSDSERFPTFPRPMFEDGVGAVVATEVLEHLSAPARAAVMWWALENVDHAIFSVPNNRLGPDEEPQHTIKFTAVTFRRELEQTWPQVRVQVLGQFLVAHCSRVISKPYRLSMCLPVRDEALDLAKTLASFRGVVDEIVVGIDPRTKDGTREIAEAYADVVFDLVELQGPPDKPEEHVPPEGIHFAHARNQCMDRCTGDWIFMTEGHEHLLHGHDVLLNLHRLVNREGRAILHGVAPGQEGGARVGYVWRQGTGERWAFPWLTFNDPRLRYTRSTHNALDVPEDYLAAKLPQVVTHHKRHQANANARAVQRKIQNRKTLLDDWEERQDASSLFYLGQELRHDEPERARVLLREYLEQPEGSGVARYQARLMLSRLLAAAEEMDEARQVLLGCALEDWSRTEHWIRLGDIAALVEDWEQAHQFYRYAGTTVGNAPFTLWWHDTAAYGYLACQRISMSAAELGRWSEALVWARQVRALLPEGTGPEAYAETDRNIALLEEQIAEQRAD